MSHSARLVQKLWSYCNVLRDDGLSYQDYLEQLTFLLFLKMSDERAKLTGEEEPVPAGYRWSDLAAPRMEGAKLEEHYRATLAAHGTEGGMLGLIFRKAQNRIQDPAKLRKLIVDLIGTEQWLTLSADVEGDACEGLLERNAQDTRSGAGQYFTVRPLIEANVDCVQPRPGEVMSDPAAGTVGFALAFYAYVSGRYDLDRDQKRHLKYDAIRLVELVDAVSRLCAMNLLLHGIGPTDDTTDPPIRTDDSLRDVPSDHYDVVMTNPPFGKKSSITVVDEEGDTDRQALTYNRPDFWTTTSNKQLNFVQHIRSLLKINGRAAVVVPDNVLFEGGAGEVVRRRLMHECDLHTILRLPTGIFYAQGVKGQRHLLRPQARPRGAVDPGRVVPRPANQQALHAKAEPHDPGRPRRVRRVLPPRRPPQPGADLERGQSRRPLAGLHLRRARRPRQGQPRHLLAAR